MKVKNRQSAANQLIDDLLKKELIGFSKGDAQQLKQKEFNVSIIASKRGRQSHLTSAEIVKES